MSPKGSLLTNWKCMLACFLVSMGPFQYGIDGGLIGGLQAMVGFLQIFGYPDPTTPIGYNISAEVQQLIGSLVILGCCIGSIGAGSIGVYVGRRPSLWIASALAAVADAVMLGTTSVGGLYAGRLLLGISHGFFMTFSQLYIQECAPAHLRGIAMGFYQWWCAVGGLVGTVVDNFTAPLPGRACYLIPLALVYIMPVVISIGVFFIPESPRWLVQHGKVDAARKALYWLRPDKDVVERELADVITAADEEQSGNGTRVSFTDLVRDPVDRRRTILSIIATSVNGASGSMYLLLYGTYFFEMANVGQPFMNACITTAIGVIAITISFYVITVVGRRSMLIGGMLACSLCQLAVAIAYTVSPGTVPTGKAIVAFSCIFLFFCSGCISPYAWLVGGEIPSQRLRSMTIGVAACAAFFIGWLIGFTAPYFINPASINWGARYGYVWCGSCLITAIVLGIFLPETKDRTLEELDEMFAERLPALKFAGYVCKGGAAKADEESASTPIDEKAPPSVDFIEDNGKSGL